MKQLVIIFMIVIIQANSLPAAKKSYAVITAKTGLNLRNKPSILGEKIVNIPFKTKIELLDERAYFSKKYNNSIRYTDTGKKITQTREWKISRKIGTRYGYWQKAKWKNQTGWVLSAWLRLANSDKSIELLSKIPQDYFIIRNGDSSKNININCLEGYSTFTFNLLKGDKPKLWASLKHDGMVFTIKNVKKINNSYKITTEQNPNVKIIIRKMKNNIFSIRIDLSKYKTIPIPDFKGKFNIKCSENP